MPSWADVPLPVSLSGAAWLAAYAVCGVLVARACVRYAGCCAGRRSRRAERAARGPTAFPPLTADDAEAEVARLRATFESGLTRPIEWRRQQLLSLLDLIDEHEKDICHAVSRDLGKNEIETMLTDVSGAYAEIRFLADNVGRLCKPKHVWPTISTMPNSTYVRKEPRGVVLVIGTWNYSVGMHLVPLAGAIAGGNCVVLKLSESAPALGMLFASLIPKFLDMRAITLEYEGGADVISAVMRQPIDMVFFTGSNRVGKILAQAAAPTLTPVVLELGGKNPAIVDSTADLRLAGTRIAWGKWVNAGQTCIAPDYVIVVDPAGADGPVATQLIAQIKQSAVRMWGEDPRTQGMLCRLSSRAAAERMAALIEECKAADCVEFGGEYDFEERYVAPTIVTLPADSDSALLRDEIFGPVLPVVVVPTLERAISLANSKQTPLAAQVFTSDSAAKRRVMDGLRSGAILVNEVIVHFSHGGLPFGGVGMSGLGSYHGKYTIRAFTHARAVVESASSSMLDLPLRYPPYGWFHRVLCSLMKKFN
eukprot:m51a1_g1223 putative aldehyde dehydrogenase (536) ;mRNA; r:507939-509936